MDSKQEYLTNELWILSWGASVQRANLFQAGVRNKERQDFRQAVIEYLKQQLLPQYADRVPEGVHERNIIDLSEFGTSTEHDILEPEGYKIGVAQKLLNLHLKYLWCLGVVAEPPHCPVDRIVIGKTDLRGTVAWTRITTIDEYRRIIAALKEKAAERRMSLAEWELSIYERPWASKH